MLQVEEAALLVTTSDSMSINNQPSRHLASSVQGLAALHTDEAKRY
jgi:hypothetical protein